MRHTRMMAVVGAAAIGCTAFATTTATAQTTGGSAAPSTQTSPQGTFSGDYVVLVKKGQSVDGVVSQLKKAGAKVTSVNRHIGMVTVASSDTGFAAKARSMKGVEKAAAEISVGQSPKAKGAAPKDEVLKENQTASSSTSTAKAGATRTSAAAQGDPLDSKLWGLDMVESHKARGLVSDSRSRAVKVAVIDTGVQANHPDIKENFSTTLSKNFARDIPMVDGECEYDGCLDPATVDHGGHGTHVAGTIAAAENGFGLSGVAPDVTLANVRAGQDSGYFFLGPTVNAITWAADQRMDVANMSFYVDPYAFYCRGGAPEDNPEQAAQQDVTIDAMERVLDYAHRRNLTLVGALGNGHDDLAKPRNDTSSPNFPDGVAHERTIDNAKCMDLPIEGPHVIGVSSVGPSKTKADYSNWTTDLTSDEIEVSAPGGWFRDGFGTDSSRTNENLILSAAPTRVLQEEGLVGRWGHITADGKDAGVIKQCSSTPVASGATKCGYYQYLQGTSMASPHAAGVAAHIVAKRGSGWGKWFGLDPDTTRHVLMKSAVNQPCPAGGVQSYTREGRSEEFTATCVSKPGFNGFYGDGIVNAYRAVTYNR